MLFTNKTNVIRLTIVIASFVVIALILWNTYTFFQVFKNEERLKMNIWATAQKSLINANEHTDVELPLEIFSSNNSIPIILTENDTIISVVNVDDKIIQNEKLSRAYLQKLKSENTPIEIEYATGKFQKLNYGNSAMLNKLTYYPVALLGILFFFGIIILVFYNNSKKSEQNRLWAGLAKETAHQISTPLTSIMGWFELLKNQNIDKSCIFEMEKDIERLNTIADRFSKIGSTPVLTKLDIIKETSMSYKYLESRFSGQVKFSYDAPELSTEVEVLLNPILHSWTIENLVKNAIDAVKGRGNVDLKISIDDLSVKINISDNGSGILKANFKRIFEPGFTTKKRGWGLGLSLTKRIVEEYHKGSIKVLTSEIGKGTTIQLVFPIAK